MLTADEMALDEDLFVQRGKIVHRLRKRVLHFRQGRDGGANDIEDTDALGLFGPAGKSRLPDVARQSHATGHYNPVVRAFAPGGVRRWFEKLVNGHRTVKPLNK